MVAKSIFIVSCDPYLAGLFGRKFEVEGWDVKVVENVKDAGTLIMKERPNAILLQKDCCADIVSEIEKIRLLPGMQKMKIIIIASDADREEVARARNAGADDYLLIGHFVAHEAVEKIKQLISKE